MAHVSKVLFVCLGNICRSPTAEAVLRKMAPELQVDSAGTAGWHIGRPPHPPAIEAARHSGYDMSDLRARQFSSTDFLAFDLIICMDQENIAAIEAMRPDGVDTPVELLLSFLPGSSTTEVPDPYFTGDYQQALALIESATVALLLSLKS